MKSSNFTSSIGPKFVSPIFKGGLGSKLAFLFNCAFGEVIIALYA